MNVMAVNIYNTKQLDGQVQNTWNCPVGEGVKGYAN